MTINELNRRALTAPGFVAVDDGMDTYKFDFGTWVKNNGQAILIDDMLNHLGRVWLCSCSSAATATTKEIVTINPELAGELPRLGDIIVCLFENESLIFNPYFTINGLQLESIPDKCCYWSSETVIEFVIARDEIFGHLYLNPISAKRYRYHSWDTPTVYSGRASNITGGYQLLIDRARIWCSFRLTSALSAGKSVQCLRFPTSDYPTGGIIPILCSCNKSNPWAGFSNVSGNAYLVVKAAENIATTDEITIIGEYPLQEL